MPNQTAHPIIVGASLSLSGRFTAQGRQAQGGLVLWGEDVNLAGGMRTGEARLHRPVRLLIYDDASKKAQAAENTRRLIMEDRVNLLFGPYSSVLALTAAEVAADYDRTIWNHGGSSDAMVGRGWHHVVNLLSPASGYFVPLLEMGMQTADRPIRTVALVHGAGGTFPAAVADGAEAHARHLGLDIVLTAAYPTMPASRLASSPRAGEGEMQRLVREIGEGRPDVILGVGTTEADILFAREIRAQGVRAAVIELVAAAVQPFRDALGDDADGFCGPSQWEPTLRDHPAIGPTSAEFAARFRARSGREPDYTAAQAYAAGLVAGRCVARAGSLDDGAIRAEAVKLDATTFYGRFRTDPLSGQQVGHQMVVVQWQAGCKEIIWPPAAATTSHVPG